MSIQETSFSHKLELSDSSISQEIDKDNSKDKYKSNNRLIQKYHTEKGMML